MTGLLFWHVSRGGYKVADLDAGERKRILADPVSEYSDLHPEACDQTIAEIQALAQQYNEIDNRHRDAKDQTRQLSASIGAARKSSANVDEFMPAMRRHSIRLKELSRELVHTGNHILAYFEQGNDNRNEKNESPATIKREYSGQAEDCRNVCVSLEVEPGDDWNRYAESNPCASIYHRAEWKQLIRKSLGHVGYYFAARNSNGDITGILPLIRLTSRLFGDYMVSVPYFNYGGAVAQHPLIEQQLMRSAADHAADLNVDHVEFRDDVPRVGYPVRSNKANMLLSLPDSDDALWHAFKPKLRAQIRRPQREDTQTLHGNVELLDEFYAVLVRNMRDLGTPIYGKSFFRNILKTFPGESFITVVRLQQKPVSAAFLIGHRDTLEIPWASTIRDVNHLSMNMLLYWEVLKFAIDRNFRQFDFGRSSVGSGTYRFKRQWGAQPRQLYWHYWLKQGRILPALNPDNPKYALAISTWRRLPLFVTTRLGPLIAKNLP